MSDLAYTIREHVRRKARADHEAGLPLDAHNMNPSAALDDYLAERAFCSKMAKRQAEICRAQVCLIDTPRLARDHLWAAEELAHMLSGMAWA